MAKNLKAASKKSIYEGKVNQVKELGINQDEFIQQEGLSQIENILGDFIERVKQNIDDEKDMVVTGGISNIQLKAENNQVNVYANPWLIYQDRGVNGAKNKLYNTPHSYSDKMPPVQVFKDWIKSKNIQLKNNEDYAGKPSPFKELTEDEQINKAAWGMAKNVFNNGFKPRNIYSKEIPQLMEDLKTTLGTFLVQSLSQVIDVKPQAKRIIK